MAMTSFASSYTGPIVQQRYDDTDMVTKVAAKVMHRPEISMVALLNYSWTCAVANDEFRK